MGDNADLDDDNDGIPDTEDNFNVLDNSFDPFGELIDPELNGVEREFIINESEFDENVYPSPLLTPGSNNIKESTWNVTGIENYPNALVEIYNRNGQREFRKTNYQNDWEGDFNNQRLPSGSYYFNIYVPELDKSYTGWLFITY